WIPADAGKTSSPDGQESPRCPNPIVPGSRRAIGTSPPPRGSPGTAKRSVAQGNRSIIHTEKNASRRRRYCPLWKRGRRRSIRSPRYPRIFAQPVPSQVIQRNLAQRLFQTGLFERIQFETRIDHVIVFVDDVVADGRR